MSGLDPKRWRKKIDSCLSGIEHEFCTKTVLTNRGEDYAILFPAHMRGGVTPELVNNIRAGLGMSKHVAFAPSDIKLRETPLWLIQQDNAAEKNKMAEEFEASEDVQDILNAFNGTVLKQSVRQT